MVKQCRRCYNSKPTDQFPKCKSNKDGLYSYCKDCNSRKATGHYLINSDKKKAYQRSVPKNTQRDRNLKSTYGINLDQYELMLKNQDNKCAICRQPETHMNIKSNKVSMLSVDHDHATGKVRALLCNKCNRGIGCFEDNPEFCISAAQYLTKHKDTID